MAQITYASMELTPREQFKILNGKCESLKNCIGNTYDIVGYAKLDTENKDGTPVELVVFITESGECIATNSKVCIKSFEAMVEAFGTPTVDTPITEVQVIEGTSKNGRTFLDITLA